MGQVVILEGPDNIGKTWFGQKLAKKHNAKLVHCGPPKGDVDKVLQSQLDLLDETMDNVDVLKGIEIWDRSVVGESVYGPLYRNYDHSQYFERLKELLHEYESKILLIVFYANEETYEKFGIPKKADEKVTYQTKGESQRISVKFVDVATELGLRNTLYINCNNYSSIDARNNYIDLRINAWLKRKRFEFVSSNDYTRTFFNLHDRLWENGIGFIKSPYKCKQFDKRTCKIGVDFRKDGVTVETTHVNPTGAVGATKNVRYIFVGESTGFNDRGPQLCHPFYNGASGCLFQTTLTSLGIHPTYYYLTNVLKCNPKDHNLAKYLSPGKDPLMKFECVQRFEGELDNIRADNPDAKVISLGAIASKELSRLKIDHAMVYHPAYYLRMGIRERFMSDLKVAIAEGL